MRDRHNFLKRHLEQLLNDEVLTLTHLAGGDINDAFRLTTAAGAHHFVKTHQTPPPNFFSAERDGLEALRQSRTLPIPEVRLCFESPDFSCLILEYIDEGGSTTTSSRTFGRELAELHRTTQSEFGFHRENYIGTLVQENSTSQSWATFYGNARIMPQVRRAKHNGLVPHKTLNLVDRVLQRLPELVGPPEAPSLVHGDLWGGNHVTDRSGRTWLIDPATYYGHREIDLAMMRLFGGFRKETFESYHETFPLQEGWQERIELYQLYPMLVHLNLFGRSYLPSVHRILERYS